MRICIIFNPAARGEKARRFKQYLDQIGPACVLKPTTAPGAGRFLAAEAVKEGYDTIVAADGDGTLNEVVNGIVDAPAYGGCRDVGSVRREDKPSASAPADRNRDTDGDGAAVGGEIRLAHYAALRHSGLMLRSSVTRFVSPAPCGATTTAAVASRRACSSTE